MALLIQWTWVWASSRSWWWTGGLACCSPWGLKESDTTVWLNWAELIYMNPFPADFYTWYNKRIQLSLLHVGIQFFNPTHWRDYLFPIIYSWCPCPGLDDITCTHPTRFLGRQDCSHTAPGQRRSQMKGCFRIISRTVVEFIFWARCCIFVFFVLILFLF